MPPLPATLSFTFSVALESRRRPRPRLQWLLAAFFVFLAGCSPWVKPEQPVSDEWFSLLPSQTTGQTFVAPYDGLSGVALLMKSEQPGDGQMLLRLLDRENGAVIAAASLSLSQVDQARYYRFDFPPLTSSTRPSYMFSLELVGEGSVQISTAPGDRYLAGGAYLDGQPIARQLTFRLAYDPTQAALGLVREVLTWLAWIAASLWLFALPGWGLFAFFWSGWQRISNLERLILSAGLGLAVYPVLMLAADLAGLHPGVWFAWLPPLLSLIYLSWKRFRLRPTSQGFSKRGRVSVSPPGLALLGVCLLVIGARMWAMRGLDAPMWGDSLQHSTIAQRIVDQGGLFSSWEPYYPYSSLTVQFGFPAATALYMWLLDQDVLLATLLAGQFTNILAVLSIYPLATRLAGGSRWAGVGAVLAAGLLSPMPAYYINWGRYAQLAGFAVLPTALWLLWGVLERDGAEDIPSWRGELGRWLAAGLALAGMTLCYYRMPFYYAAFILVWLASAGLLLWGSSLQRWSAGIGRMVGAGGLGILLLLPWAPRLFGSQLAEVVESGIAAGTPLQILVNDLQAWREFLFFAPYLLWMLAIAGFLTGILRRRWLVVALPLWMVLLVAYSAGQVIRLPGANMMTSFAILIALYLPLSLLAGFFFEPLASLLIRFSGRLGPTALLVLVLGLAIWGAQPLRLIADPLEFALVTHPDLAAMDWIKKNTPADSRFLVEGFTIWSGKSVVGSDAGWWLPLLSGRQNTLPPQYALLNEKPILPGFTQDSIDLVGRLEAAPISAPDNLRLICEQGVTHVYIGQRQGLTGAGARQLFSADALSSSPAFERIYAEDQVSIFRLAPQACEVGP